MDHKSFGTSLIEVLVSLAIFSTVILGLCTSSIQSLRMTHEAFVRSQMELLPIKSVAQ